MSVPQQVLARIVGRADRWQRRSRVAGPAYAVVKKFSDDDANLLVVALGWYGFAAIYPLLLVVITVFGFIGAASLGDGILGTLHHFPVIGMQFKPGPGGANLHGSTVGLIVGLIGLLYGAQGVTQTAEQAMNTVWNQPATERPGFLPRLLRSLGGLATIAGAFVVNAFLASIAAGHGRPLFLRVGLVLLLLVVNIGFYLATFRVLTSVEVTSRQLLPGSIVGSVGFTALTTLGAGLVQHQLRNSSDTYGAFGAVIGMVTFLLLLAKLSLYAAEINPVLARRLWPRALPTTTPTEADNQVLRDVAHQDQRRPDERIGVGFGRDATSEAAVDAGQDAGGRA